MRTKARILRKTATDAEKILWAAVRNHKLGFKFRRQYPIDSYILDFYIPSSKIAIELDGYAHSYKENIEYDQDRTQYLNQKGIHILRFFNREIEENLEATLNKIKKAVEKINLPTPRR